MFWLGVVRDIVIILVALTSLVAFGLLAYAGWQALLVVRTLRAQVPPVLDTAKHTLGTVEGTATFLSEEAIVPVVRAWGIVAAVTRFLQILLRPPRGRRS